jgi:calcium/calmodulin-dependent protein kinase I
VLTPNFHPNFYFYLRFSAKHLNTSDEQIFNVAGSFGYVAPEVLSEKGHGKAVDIWSTGYVFKVFLYDDDEFYANHI